MNGLNSKYHSLVILVSPFSCLRHASRITTFAPLHSPLRTTCDHRWIEYRKQSGGKDPRSKYKAAISAMILEISLSLTLLSKLFAFAAASSTLGKWVSKTRVRYHDTRDNKVPDYITKEQHHLTEEQIEKLKSLGFDFGERDYSRVVRSWDERFEELLAFRAGKIY